jgi:hypothetical protein
VYDLTVADRHTAVQSLSLRDGGWTTGFLSTSCAARGVASTSSYAAETTAVRCTARGAAPSRRRHVIDLATPGIRAQTKGAPTISTINARTWRAKLRNLRL